MQLVRHDGLSAEPNVTPMIDVLLVVIIVFMVAMVRVYHTMDAQLPDVCAGACESTVSIVLEVLPGRQYRINRQDVRGDELPARLRSIYSARPEKVIQVAGHPNVPYEDVIVAMDVAKSAGVREIGIVPKGLSGVPRAR